MIELHKRPNVPLSSLPIVILPKEMRVLEARPRRPLVVASWLQDFVVELLHRGKIDTITMATLQGAHVPCRAVPSCAAPCRALYALPARACEGGCRRVHGCLSLRA